MSELYEGLPGADWILRGVRELRAGVLTPAAFCVAGATQLLRDLGLDLPADLEIPVEPELALYRALGDADDPYGRYNAMRRELDSFATALRSRLKGFAA